MVDAAFLAHYVGRTILITGAAGFLGRHLTARVASLARSVVCVARGPRAGSHRNVRFHPVDLNDADRTCAFFDTVKPDIVFHLASASGGSTGVENVLPHLRDDICTTVNCLVAAQKTGVSRFVIPGSTDEPPPGADYVPDSPYSMAKMTCVTFGRMFHELYAVPTVICRIFMTYGPGQKPRKIVPFMIRSMLAHEAPTLNSGARLVDWVFVDDTVDALMLAGTQAGGHRQDGGDRVRRVDQHRRPGAKTSDDDTRRAAGQNRRRRVLRSGARGRSRGRIPLSPMVSEGFVGRGTS